MNIELTDLRGITRDSDKVITRVYIKPHIDDHEYRDKEWLVFGQAQVRNEDRGARWLAAYMTAGVTDFEHDSAYALRLPLIGIQFEYVSYHTTRLKAYVDPNNKDEFRVPLPGYDPTMLDDVYMCTDCKSRGGEEHIIVPEGYYCPPFNEKLYEKVRGRELLITIGPNWKELEDK